MIPIFLATIKKNHILFCDIPKYISYISKFKDEELVEVTIKKRTKKRTNSQNSYLWGVCYKIIGDDLGYDIEDVHEIMKQRFLLKRKEINIKGKKITLCKTLSTTKLSTKQFGEYVDEVKNFASSELGIYIPDPGEIEFADYV